MILKQLRQLVSRRRPDPPAPPPHPLNAAVLTALDACRPAIQSHGGEIDLVRIDADNVVHVRLRGACHNCNAAADTLQWLVEAELRARVPGIAEVQASD